MRLADRFRVFALSSVDDHRTVIPRLATGLIFLTEGIQKFLFPALLGPGRFEKIGFYHPAFWAHFTGVFEILCGALVLAGLFVRLASIPLLIIMITAFVTTKWPLLVTKGFWPFAHDYRTDFAMTLLLIYLLIYNGGRWSLNSVVFKSGKDRKE